MSYANAVKTARIVRDADGSIVGRTRLQKVAYLLTVTGLEHDLAFSYKHYGPYSEDLAMGAREADLLGLLKETEQQASWGGTYSTYSYVAAGQDDDEPLAVRRLFAVEAARGDAIELELAATAVFLALENYPDPWEETQRRKPEKAAHGRIAKAQALYRRLAAIDTPVRLPDIA